jgi:hypothetical protein
MNDLYINKRINGPETRDYGEEGWGFAHERHWFRPTNWRGRVVYHWFDFKKIRRN